MKSYKVGLTAPQIELSNGTIAMFWYSDQEIEANNKTEARKIVNKMIDSLDYDLMDENGDDLTTEERLEALDEAGEPENEPKIDYIEEIDHEM